MNNEKMKKLKRLFLGSRREGGLLSKIFIYTLLIGISFIFLYPLLQMFATSLMSLEDLIDPTTIWIPSTLVGKNYSRAFVALKFWQTFKDSVVVSLMPTILGVITSSLIGYGFARYDFPLKKMWFAILIIVFLVPVLLTSIPIYVIYNQLGLLQSLKAYTYPALTGFGLRQSVFILIFYQFFKNLPHELSESAEIDGASAIQTFIKVAVPMVIPAFIICILYSFVWYWNETTLAITYFQGKYTTLQIAVSQLESAYRTLFPSGSIGIDSASESFNQGVLFAGTTLSILPLLILYAFTQKWFVESADKSGIAGN